MALTLGLAQLDSELDTMSCRVRLTQKKRPRRCQRTTPPRDGEPIYSARQRFAIRWANFHMAMGGYAVGFSQVARETLELDLRSTDATLRERQALTLEERLRFCGPGATTGDPLVLESDFAMESKNVRRIVAHLAEDTPVGKSRSAPHVIRGGYANPYTTWRVALALLVPGAKITVTRRDAEHVDVEWRGDIQYPVASAVHLPIPFGGPLTLDEAIFCGMQMDGDFVPYTMVWRWTLAADDPRLKP